MQIVIEIPEEDYEIMKHNIDVNNPLCPLSQEEMVSKVADGTPLPKVQTDMLDEIRAEIVHLHDWAFSREDVLKIIDKYRTESEVQDAVNN